jgi:hypothetical protein
VTRGASALDVAQESNLPEGMAELVEPAALAERGECRGRGAPQEDELFVA